MPAQHVDKLVKSFLSGSSNPLLPFDPFSDLQDPTYLSFKIDFFPDGGYSFPDDTYASGGLFRNAGLPGLTDYGFFDSAADYLARIGAPARQMYLEIFISMLAKIQNEAPWYFQSVSGLGDLYKIDPAINFRGKDKVLTIDCLESIDLRVSLLADAYRNAAFDMQNMREVLPINLRTFNMNIHVLEFRRFNTTFGIIADAYGQADRSVTGQNNQQNQINSAITNQAIDAALAASAFAFPFPGNVGLNPNRSSETGQNVNQSLKSAFEAISVQTFVCKDCEFDFYSESPGYLDTVSVADIGEASHRFKIKVGKVQKTSAYPFYNYIISEHTKNSRIDASKVATESQKLNRSFTPTTGYFEQNASVSAPDSPKDLYRNIRESIFPTADGLSPESAGSDAYTKQARDAFNIKAQAANHAQAIKNARNKTAQEEQATGPSVQMQQAAANHAAEVKAAKDQAAAEAVRQSQQLRSSRLERLLGGVVRSAVGSLEERLQTQLGRLTGGIIGREPFGNIYGSGSLAARIREGINDFLTPGNQITLGQQSYRPPSEILQKIKFDSLNLDSTISPKNVGFTPISLDTTVQENVFQGTPPMPTTSISQENVFQGTPPLPTDNIGQENVFQGTPPLPTDSIGNINVYAGTPPLPTDQSGLKGYVDSQKNLQNSSNVFK